MLEQLKRLTDAFAAGDLETCAALTSQTWSEPRERPTEVSPREHWASLGEDIRSALSGWQIELDDWQQADGLFSARLRASATFENDLWNYPATGKRIAMEATIKARVEDDGLVWWLGDWVPILTLRDLGLVPPPEFMDRPLAYPVRIPDAVLKWAFNGGFMEKPCSHLHEIVKTDTAERGCKACDDAGVEYPATRMCLVCGHVGCCDTAKNKHARQHFEETGHPLMRSLRLDESWVWCYVDETVMSAKW